MPMEGTGAFTAEELQLVADNAERLFGIKAGVAAHRKLRDAHVSAGFDSNVWMEMAELGWLAMPWRPEDGGLGLGYAGLFEVGRRAGANLVSSPLVESVWIGGTILSSSSSHSPFVSALGAGSFRCALALDERARHDPLRIAARAERNGDGFLLRGVKSFVPYAVGADALLVVARDAEDGALLIARVDRASAGLTLEPLTTISPCGAARAVLAGVAVRSEQIVVRGTDAEAALGQALSLARVATAAEMLGASEALFERTLAYVKEREQFGKPIAAFQSVRHRLADMFCRIELARSVLFHAVECVDGDAAEDTLALRAWHAKEQAGMVLMQVSREAVQLHGGIAMTDEFDIGLFLKRAQLWEMLYGDADFQRTQYLMRERAA
jgi:alkylation response protein AidB-like acyl-CoA dehydrogenase